MLEAAMTVSRYPLAWPAGWPRRGSRIASSFKVSFDKALAQTQAEIERLDGCYPVLSTNYPLRLDGTLVRQREPADPGAAIYFSLKDKQRVFACNTFLTVGDNIRAIGLTIEAFRRIERYGASTMMERALEAFTALPAPLDPWQILGIPAGSPVDKVEAAFRALAKQHHPDLGGSAAKMAELNRARELALKGNQG
jgi:hypothetical protein